ncbi:MAG: DUF2088 domain-containing protein, partial [Firmicutes bacterium]|nr:DUF2088 domain-containing protein [Bacillota bacterium]
MRLKNSISCADLKDIPSSGRSSCTKVRSYDIIKGTHQITSHFINTARYHMLLDFGIGKETQQVEVRDDLVLDVLTASEYEAKESEEKLVKDALSSPIGSLCLKDIVSPG